MQTDSASIEQILKQQGFLLRPVVGDSMMPLLDQKTDIVKIIPISDDLKPYDLPLYRRPNGALVMHRVVKVLRRHYVICGDNREVYERVPKHWIVGLAVGRFRGDDYLAFDSEEYLSDIRRLCEQRDRISVRFRVNFARVFPPFRVMKRQYSILRQSCVLLPFCYVARWFRVLFKK